MKTEQCLTDQQLRGFDLGKLPAQRYEQAALHLDSCEHCAQRFTGLESGDDALLGHLRQEMPEEILHDDSEVQGLVEAAAALSETADTMKIETQDPEARYARPDLQEAVSQILAPPETDDELGRLGGYRVLKVLGAGGMGVVFLAEDPKLKRRLALKAIKPSAAAQSEAAVERFLREAQATAALDHDHIVTVHQVGEDRGVPFIAMQLLKGQSLGQRLKRERSLPLAEVLRIGKEAACGLSVAHAKGLIHRDIKPDNLWLEEKTGRVKILDFGLAQDLDQGSDLTQSGAIVGTPSYLSPEQVQGRPADERSDLFSLGVVIYQMLTGRSPFYRNKLLPTLRAVADEMPQSPHEIDDEVPTGVSELTMRLLEKNPQERIESADELIATIESLEAEIDGEVGSAVSGRATLKTQMQKAPTRRLVATALVLLAAVLAAVVIYVKTDRGTIVVRAGEGFQITSEDRLVTIRDAKSGRTYQVQINKEERLPSGDYELLVSDNEGLAFQAQRFEVRRGDRNLEVSLLPVKPTKIADSNLSATDLSKVSFLPSPMSLVQRPEKLPGVKAWTLETDLHRGPVNDLQYRPDGSVFATAGDDGTVRVWVPGKSTSAKEDEPLELVRVIAAHREPVATLDWSPDGKTLATGTETAIRIWNPDEGRLLKQFNQSCDLLAYSPDGKRLAIRSGRGTLAKVKVLSAHDGKIQHTFRGEDAVGLEWMPDSKSLVVGYGPDVKFPGAVTFWSVETGKPLRQWDDIEGSVSAIALSPDGKQIALGARKVDDPARIFDIETRKLIQEHAPTYEVAAGKPPISAIHWSPRGDEVYESRKYGGGFHWTSGQVVDVRSAKRRFGMSSASDDMHTVERFSPDGESISILSRRTGSLNVIGGSQRSVLRKHRVAYAGFYLFGSKNFGESFSVSHDRQYLASLIHHPQKATWVWDVNGPPRILPQQRPNLPASKLSWSPTSHHLIEGSVKNNYLECKIWDTKELKVLATLEKSHTVLHSPIYLHWSPDGKRLIRGYWKVPGLRKTKQKVFVIYDAQRGVVEREFELLLPEGLGSEPRWAPSSSAIAWSAGNKQTFIWRDEKADYKTLPGYLLGWHPQKDWLLLLQEDAAELRSLQDEAPLVRFPFAVRNKRNLQVAWSGDAAKLALATTEQITVLDAKNGKILDTRKGANIQSCAFTPDGRGLVVLDESGWTLWNSETDKPVHHQPLYKLFPSVEKRYTKWLQSDGRSVWLVGGSQIRIWDTASGDLTATYIGMSTSPLLEWLKIKGDGHYVGSKRIDQHLRAVVHLESGEQLTLTADEFAKRFGFKNDPGRFRSNSPSK